MGGLVAKLRDSGFSDARLEAIGEGMPPGSSAIVAVVEHKWVEQVEKALFGQFWKQAAVVAGQADETHQTLLLEVERSVDDLLRRSLGKITQQKHIDVGQTGGLNLRRFTSILCMSSRRDVVSYLRSGLKGLP